ncbi:MAG: HD domain-containing protein [Ruminococcaceae bacterium]|nr:HD domain-containing protein [Oscillospiraceae bacterium]
MNFTPLGSTNSHEGYCLIKTVEKKLTAKGVPYLDMTLADNSGEINAKLWDYKESASNQFNALDFAKVRGTYVPFNDTVQFRVERIRNVIPEDNVAIEDYVPSACLTGQVMLAEIEKTVASFKDNELKTLVKAVVEKYREKLLYWPAAKNLHHAVRSGLLMHTLSILRLAKGVCSIYRFVNYDLLCAGAILHDIAKIDEMQASSTGIAAEYTVKGNLLGHLVMGAINIDRIGRELGISDETLTLVEHMLISHHGTPEFGAAKMPMFIEAELLSQLDLMDARLYEMHAAVEAVDEGAFTPRQWALENRNLYNHGKAYDGGVELMNEEENQ